jgi:hypothetical protein
MWINFYDWNNQGKINLTCASIKDWSNQAKINLLLYDFIFSCIYPIKIK